MAYNKTTWETGDVITAEKLNNAEAGIAAAQPFIINIVIDTQAGTVSLDQKYADINAAQLAGRYCPVFDPEGYPAGMVMQTIPGEDSGYEVVVMNGVSEIPETGSKYPAIEIYTCQTVDDYPLG